MIQSLFRLIGIMPIAWSISENKRSIRYKSISTGLILQFIVATLMLKVTVFSDAMMYLNHAVDALQLTTQAGTSLLFGYIGGGPLPFAESLPGASCTLAFRTLPLIRVHPFFLTFLLAHKSNHS